MMLRGGLMCYLAIVACTSVAAVQVINPAGIETANLSSCGTTCTTRVLSSYRCTNNDTCFCSSKPLQADISACLDECPFSDQFYYSGTRAKICKTPVKSRGATLSGVAYALFGLATISTIARLVARWTRVGGHGYWWDDYAAILAYPFLVALTASQALAVQGGTGRDIWGLDLNDFKDVLYWLYIAGILWTPVVFFTKVSLVSAYLRIWNAATWFRSFCLGALVSLSLGYVVFQIVAVAQCSPTSYAWKRIEDTKLVEAHLKDAVQGSCIDQQDWLWASSAVIVVFDLIVALLPISKLLKSSMSGMEKFGVASTYVVGLVVLASGLARFAYINNISDRSNPSRYYSHFYLIAIIEANVSQICCCMPAILNYFGHGGRTRSTGRSRSNRPSRLISLFTFNSPTSPTFTGDTFETEKPPASARSRFSKSGSLDSLQRKPQTPRQFIASAFQTRSKDISRPVIPPRRFTPSPQSPFVYASDREEGDERTTPMEAVEQIPHSPGAFLPGDGFTQPSPSAAKISFDDVDTALPPPPIIRGPSPSLSLPSKREKRWSALSSIGESRRGDGHIRIEEEDEESDGAMPPPISRGPSPAMVGPIRKEKRLSGLSALRVGAGSRQEVSRTSSLRPHSSDEDSDSALPPSVARGPSPLPTSTSRQEKRSSGLRISAGSRQEDRSPSPLIFPPAAYISDSDYDSDLACPPPGISRGPSPLPGAVPAPLQPKTKRFSGLSRLTSSSRQGAQSPTKPTSSSRPRADSPPKPTHNDIALSDSDSDSAVPAPLFNASRAPSPALVATVQSVKRHNSLRSSVTFARSDDRARSPTIFEESQRRISETVDDDAPAEPPIVPRLNSLNSAEPGQRPPSRRSSMRSSGLMHSLGLSGRSKEGRVSSPTMGMRPGSSASVGTASGWRISDGEVARAVEEGREKRISGMVGPGGGIAGRASSDLVPFARSGRGVDVGRTGEWVRRSSSRA
ncbi:unnamed protein product [Zymoseptoria tritici ST99CH_1E4]|uniref:CFEM domain-containing protein n=1 Tax=Zymoseptoria tritici ST99CH_1E4 TaxID=1276532 RepID=A0A2H1H3B9_ZYMTR|nr:unnamed protein product [Zymoseptoria tritici ST99CH_1E4]